MFLLGTLQWTRMPDAPEQNQLIPILLTLALAEASVMGSGCRIHSPERIS